MAHVRRRNSTRADVALRPIADHNADNVTGDNHPTIAVELIRDVFKMPGVYMASDMQYPAPPMPRPIFTVPTSRLAEHGVTDPEVSGLKRNFQPNNSKRKAAAKDKLVNFLDIVDIDYDEAFENYVSEELAGKLVDSNMFGFIILSIIIINTVLIGLQTDESLEKRMSGLLSTIDTVFLIVFVIEILLKWYSGFMAFWRVGWNVFDFLIVAASLLGPSLTFLSSGRVFKVLRVVRAFRTLRSISIIQGLQVIVQTIIQSLPDLANILFLLAITMYIFAVVGITLFGTVAPEHFEDLGVSMFTLFILVTQDGWVTIFRELEEGGQFVLGSIYFASFITIGAFILINVFVGVVVTYLQEAYDELKRKERAKHRRLERSKRVSNAVEPLRSLSKRTDRIPMDVWRQQEPLELPLFSQIPVSAVENYYLVLTAIEQNLIEYQTIKAELQEIHDSVAELNTILNYRSEEESSSFSEIEEVGEMSFGDGEATRPQGDVISQMISRDRAGSRSTRPNALIERERARRMEAAGRTRLQREAALKQTRTEEWASSLASRGAPTPPPAARRRSQTTEAIELKEIPPPLEENY